METLKIISIRHYWECRSSNLLLYSPFSFLVELVGFSQLDRVSGLHFASFLSNIYVHQYLRLCKRE